MAAGKEKIGYDAIENQNVQKFAVERIFYEPGYNHGTSNYAANIVLVILKMSIEFKSYITPICIPYGLTFAESIVPAGWKGNKNQLVTYEDDTAYIFEIHCALHIFYYVLFLLFFLKDA